MPYIGHNPTNAGSFALIDDIASTFNGSNTTFTLQVGNVNITPNAQNTIIALDGVIQHTPESYTISGSTIAFTGAPASGTDFYGILMGNSSYVENNSIGADELTVTGDGTSLQVLTSDGDGSFSWVSQSALTPSANLVTGNTLKSTVTASSLESVGTLTSLTTSGSITTTSTGLANAPSLAIDNPSSSSYIHALEAFGANMTQGQTHIFCLGKEGSTKNTAVLGYKWDSAGSNDNLFTIEHWGTGALVTVDGGGDTTFSGSVGIGVTASPHSELEIADGNCSFMIDPNDSADKVTLYAYDWNGSAYNDIVMGNDALVIKADKKVGIGCTPSYRLDIEGSEANWLQSIVNTASSGNAYCQRLEFTGVSPNNTTSKFQQFVDGGSTVRFEVRSNGGVVNFQSSDGDYSDERLKKEIVDAPNFLEKINQIKVRNFKYKDQTDDRKLIGVIAQELEQVDSNLVTEENDIKRVYNKDIMFMMLKAIQELSAKVEALENA